VGTPRCGSIVHLAASIALAGCWRDATPTAPGESPAGACPSVVQVHDPDSWLWAHELFPGCAPAPFFDEVACRGDCPAPCRSRVGGKQTVAFTYENGHLVDAVDRTANRARRAYTPPFGTPTHCTYEHGALAGCTTARGPVKVHRDAAGRIVRVDRDNGSTAITYDARGDAVQIVVHGDEWFTHNGDVTTLTVALRFDAQHRVVEERGTGETITHEYDHQGRLRDVGSHHSSFDPVTGLLHAVEDGLSSTTFRYDAAGRPIRITRRTLVRVDDKADDVFERFYEYDCR
jgi:YD repeat-containing protein